MSAKVGLRALGLVTWLNAVLNHHKTGGPLLNAAAAAHVDGPRPAHRPPTVVKSVTRLSSWQGGVRRRPQVSGALLRRRPQLGHILRRSNAAFIFSLSSGVKGSISKIMVKTRGNNANAHASARSEQRVDVLRATQASSAGHVACAAVPAPARNAAMYATAAGPGPSSDNSSRQPPGPG